MQNSFNYAVIACDVDPKNVLKKYAQKKLFPFMWNKRYATAKSNLENSKQMSVLPYCNVKVDLLHIKSYSRLCLTLSRNFWN